MAAVGYLKPAIVVDYAQLVVDCKLLLLQLVALCSRLQVYGSRLQWASEIFIFSFKKKTVIVVDYNICVVDYQCFLEK